MDQKGKASGSRRHEKERTMQMRTGVYWSVGAGGGNNQDSLSLQHIKLRRGECLLAVVCDGIGSLSHSEEASGLAVRLMTDWFYHEGKELICQNSPKEIILFALQRQISHIQEILKKFQQLKQLQTGTTLSALIIIRRHYYLIHIGDSRIYQIQKRKLLGKSYRVRLLTRDDRNEKGQLLKCLGVTGEDTACFMCGRLRKRTGFLLCTDGFAYGRQLKRFGEVIGPMLRNGGADILQRRLELLGMQAEKDGSRDNMSAIAIIV